MRYRAMAVAAVLGVMFSATTAFGELKEADLQKKVVVTEQAALLTQVDAVSLYLASERVSFAPKLSPEDIIDVEVTVLARELRDNRKRLQDFVTRQIRTFISVLEDRLPIYAPSIAKSFNPDTDLAFHINEGPERSPLATYSAGQWRWVNGAAGVEKTPSAAPAASLPPPLPSKAQETASAKNSDLNDAPAPAKKGCNCPALRN